MASQHIFLYIVIYWLLLEFNSLSPQSRGAHVVTQDDFCFTKINQLERTIFLTSTLVCYYSTKNLGRRQEKGLCGGCWGSPHATPELQFSIVDSIPMHQRSVIYMCFPPRTDSKLCPIRLPPNLEFLIPFIPLWRSPKNIQKIDRSNHIRDEDECPHKKY